MFLEGQLPESGFVGHHYSVLKERLRGPLVGPLACFSSGPAGAACQHLAVALCVSAQTQLLENCIASTSILKIPSYKEPTVDALAPDADEGRGWLR